MKPLPQDTPITRATLRMLTHEQLLDHVKEIQERRMRAQTAYEEAVAAKKHIQDEKDAAMYQKRLDQVYKSLESATSWMDKANKYMVEIQALRLTVGDLSQ